MTQDEIQKILRRGWWATRGALLFVLPLPLIAALFVSMVAGDFRSLLVDAIALALFLCGALLTRKAFKQQAEIEESRLHSASLKRFPFRTFGATCVSGGVFITSFLAIGNGLGFSLLIAALCLLGFYLSYGFDAFQKESVSGVAEAEQQIIRQTLAQALEKIEAIEATSRQIQNDELKERLSRIANAARTILETIIQTPNDLHKARKFLYVYLDGAKTVCERYALAHEKIHSAQLESNFRNVLVTIEDVFAKQQQRLIEKEMLDLDIQIEVLNTQLKQEGLS